MRNLFVIFLSFSCIGQTDDGVCDFPVNGKYEMSVTLVKSVGACEKVPDYHVSTVTFTDGAMEPPIPVLSSCKTYHLNDDCVLKITCDSVLFSTHAVFSGVVGADGGSGVLELTGDYYGCTRLLYKARIKK